MEYRGIKLVDTVKLYKKNGEYTKHVKRCLDNFAELLNDKGHVLLTHYEGTQIKVLIGFNCGHKPSWIRPNDYMNDHGCQQCGYLKRDMPLQEKAKEEFIQLVKSHGHLLLGEYSTNTTKVPIDFNCGHEPHWITPSDYKSGYGCSRCGGTSSKQSKEDFLKLIESNNHVSLTKYENIRTKVLIDFKCGHKPHWMNPNDYKNGNRCPRCSKRCPEQPKENFLKLVKQNGHILLSEYENTRKKVLIDFKCGHKPHLVIPDRYKIGSRCIKCLGLSPEQSKDKLIQMIKENGHILLSLYVNSGTKVLIDYKCGHEPHWIRPYDYKNGVDCPHCCESKGERIIQEWLNEKNISYETQFKIDKGRKAKKYDIYLPDENLIIEVHGKQHYQYCYYHEKSGKTLCDEQKNDQLKQSRAVGLGFRYMVVDYREGNPKLTLKRFIEQFEKMNDRILA